MQSPVCDSLATCLTLALQARRPLLDENQDGVVRLFNGFYEGCPDLVVDWYAGTLVMFAHNKDLASAQTLLQQAQTVYLELLPQLTCILHKIRYAADENLRRGHAVFGQPAQDVVENGVRYALDLTLNQDASFYPDTRALRLWLKQNSAGKSLLNTFAYTGSLGVAALAGGARRVVQVDRSRKFLAAASRSAQLNDLAPSQMLLDSGDFFSRAAFYKSTGELFDLAVLDAPFFSTSEKGSVDLVNQSARLINKVRPLVAHAGKLIAVNNALFLSGQQYLDTLQELCASGYLSIDEIIPIPVDITGYPHTIQTHPPVDPSPFNHPTKIVVLGVKRKG